tara:strand:+ start:4972 stop:5199 length:228 start_codon:yes stop_codon:yes gene_type:complete
MTDEAVILELVKNANTILASIREEIDIIKAQGKLEPSLDKKLVAIKTATKQLGNEILNKVFRQTRLTDYEGFDAK